MYAIPDSENVLRTSTQTWNSLSRASVDLDGVHPPIDLQIAFGRGVDGKVARDLLMRTDVRLGSPKPQTDPVPPRDVHSARRPGILETVNLWFFPPVGLLRNESTREFMSGHLVVVVLNAPPSRESIVAWASQGARSILGSTEVEWRLLPALRAVASGGSYLGAEQLRMVAGGLDSTNLALRRSLTLRERETLYFIGNGYTHLQAARRMGVSVTTINTYVSRLRDKLGPGNKARLAQLAADLDLLSRRPTTDEDECAS